MGGEEEEGLGRPFFILQFSHCTTLK